MVLSIFILIYKDICCRTDWKDLVKTWLQNGVNCKWTTQGTGMECFLEIGQTGERFPTIHLCKSEVILHYLYDYDNFSLWLWILRLSLDMESKINVFTTSCYRIMLGIKQQDCISNNAIYSMTNTESLVYYARKHQLGFLGHILHLPVEEPARRCAFICTTSWQKDWSRVIHTPLTSCTLGWLKKTKVVIFHRANLTLYSFM